MLANLLLVWVVGWLLHQPTTADERFAEAEHLARQNLNGEALQRFQEILDVEPDNVEARLWVARLLRRRGESALAEMEFRHVLGQAPDNVDALVGLATVLITRGAHAEAWLVLDHAERLSPRNADVLAERAQSLRLSGRPMAAEGYFAKAAALNPDDPDIRQGFDQVRRLNWNRVEASFQHEDLTGGSGAQLADVAADIRATEILRFSARMQAQQRASRDEVRVGGGMTWQARPNLTVRAAALFGPGADLMARTDTVGDIEQVRGRFDFGASVRWMSFATARVWIAAPGATVWFNDRTAFTVRYYGSSTRFADGPASFQHAGLVRLSYQARPRLWLSAGFSQGYESIDTLSSDRLGSLRADTVSSGLMYHLAGLQSIAANVDYQRRSDDRTMIRVTAGFVHRFR